VTGFREASGLRGLQPRCLRALGLPIVWKSSARTKAPLKRAQSRRFANER
jgi:hypothetical protein